MLRYIYSGGKKIVNEKIVLGIHIGHDRAAALLKDGYIIGSIAQERLDRIKHSRSVMIPYDAIDSLLNYHSINIRKISCVAISGDALEADTILETIKFNFYSHYNCSMPMQRFMLLVFLMRLFLLPMVEVIIIIIMPKQNLYM